MNKAFIIIMQDASLSAKKLNEFHDAIKNEQNIYAWWHHLASTYIVIVPNHITASNIQSFLNERFPALNLMILQIRYSDYDGWMPQEAWDWMENSLKEIR